MRCHHGLEMECIHDISKDSLINHKKKETRGVVAFKCGAFNLKVLINLITVFSILCHTHILTSVELMCACLINLENNASMSLMKSQKEELAT